MEPDEDFEFWYANKGLSAYSEWHPDRDEYTRFGIKQRTWEAWQAARGVTIERCAKVCESRRRTVSNGNGTSYWSHEPASVEAGHCADAISKLGDE